jgi:L-ascorbate metabolism protein UlaG (beta-lactamase superfamily)
MVHKFLTMTFIWILLKAIGFLCTAIILWYLASPVFGAKASKAELQKYAESAQFQDQVFSNSRPIDMGFSFEDMSSLLGDYWSSRKVARPLVPIPVKKVDLNHWFDSNSEGFAGTEYVWLGHSTFLLRIEQTHILIDPMFSQVPSPSPFLGGKRFSEELPFDPKNLPIIDLVLISHDHYDHLDYHSIKLLSAKVNQFVVPLGIGGHLKRWGVASEKIIELDWWDEFSTASVNLTLTPAQHFSGRALADRFHTLWGSWAIKGSSEAIFFSGDSGYAPHFKEIGEQLGPFDIAFMEAGQYNKRWPDVHMFPDQTYQAAKDIRAKAVMPIHWGAFSLAMHPWQEPAELLKSNAEKDTIQVIIPEIGQRTRLDSLTVTTMDPWWTRIQEPK